RAPSSAVVDAHDRVRGAPRAHPSAPSARPAALPAVLSRGGARRWVHQARQEAAGPAGEIERRELGGADPACLEDLVFVGTELAAEAATLEDDHRVGSLVA